MVEVNHQYELLKIRLLIKFVVTVIGSLFISAMVYLLQYQIQKSNVTLLQDNTLLAAHNTFSRELGDVRKVVKLLVADEALKRHVSDAELEQQIQTHFVNFGLAADSISQIRWLDSQGQERYRVNFKAGKAQVVAPQQLQNKGNNY